MSSESSVVVPISEGNRAEASFSTVDVESGSELYRNAIASSLGKLRDGLLAIGSPQERVELVNSAVHEEDRLTLLHAACKYVHKVDVSVVALLLDYGADPNVPDRLGRNCMHYCGIAGNLRAIHLLVHRGRGDLSLRDTDGLTPLMQASRFGQARVAQYLTNVGCSANETDNNGWNSLHWACRNNHVGVVDLLLKSFFGVRDVRDTNNNGETAAKVAQNYGHSALAERIAKEEIGTNGCLSGVLGRKRSYTFFVLYVVMISLGHLDYFWLIDKRTDLQRVLDPPFLFLFLLSSCVFLALFMSKPGYYLKHSPSEDKSSRPVGPLCPRCHFVRPLRTKHCPICDQCCAKWDHHCLWTNGCVGVGNYHLFILWIVTQVIHLLVALVIVTSVYFAAPKDSHDFQSIFALVLIVGNLIMFLYPMGSLHLPNALDGITCNERAAVGRHRQTGLFRLSWTFQNPFRNPSRWTNFMSIFTDKNNWKNNRNWNVCGETNEDRVKAELIFGS